MEEKFLVSISSFAYDKSIMEFSKKNWSKWNKSFHRKMHFMDDFI